MTCIGFVLYNRQPHRQPKRYRCLNEPVTPEGRCLTCDKADGEARAWEREDAEARAKMRAILAEAMTDPKLRRVMPPDGPAATVLRRAVPIIEAATLAAGNAGGSGNYWRALRIYLGLE